MLHATAIERPLNGLNNHLTDYYASTWPVQQILGQSRRRDIRNLFVLTDCRDLPVIKAAHGNAIFNGDHVSHSACSGPYSFWAQEHQSVLNGSTDITSLLFVDDR